MEFSQVLKDRFSCKKFIDKKIEKETLNKIFELGNLAPTAKNTQEHKIYVLEKDEVLKKFDSICPCRYNAPIVLLFSFDINNAFVYPGEKYNSGVEDCSIVATHIMLAAKNEGLDSCWLNYLDPDKMAKEFNLPENEQLVLALDMGYSDPNSKPLENHLKRKKLEETIKYL